MQTFPMFIRMVTAAKALALVRRWVCVLPFSSLMLLNSLPAQTDPPKVEEEKTFEMFDIEKQPAFPGGEQEMLKFIARNFHVPHKVNLDSLVGSRIVLSFVVDTLGHLNQIEILQDMGQGFGNEAVRVIESMPPWIPGELNGQKRSVKITLPIRPILE